MTIEELMEILNSIKGNSPIANARRHAITAEIARLLSEQEE